jgi:Calcineurin-like phosphoesterase
MPRGGRRHAPMRGRLGLRIADAGGHKGATRPWGLERAALQGVVSEQALEGEPHTRVYAPRAGHRRRRRRYGYDALRSSGKEAMSTRPQPPRRQRLRRPGAGRRSVSQRFRGSRLASPRPFAGGPLHVHSGRFAIVGDLQPTSRLEVWRPSNAHAVRQLIHQIVAERPDFLAMVGDLVLWGSSAAAWATFDALALPLWHARVPILPLLGNHDYGLARRAALTHFFTRFPHLDRRHWYSTTYGPLGLIFLDSNVRRLPAAHWDAQERWYRQELAGFERMAHILGVLVHHPPYTNSILVADSRVVQRTFVPPFVQSPKTLAMVAGHVHSYERYTRAGKTFVVSGGGGPRMKLATGRRRRHDDDCFAGPPLRDFHFLLLTLGPRGLTIAMQALQQPQQGFAPLDCFTLPWAHRSE